MVLIPSRGTIVISAATLKNGHRKPVIHPVRSSRAIIKAGAPLHLA
jgi:hypothetical protein